MGFVEDADGSLLVAAGSESADWALNLARTPQCTVTIGDVSRPCKARVVDEATHARVITELILKYGTPAERLGRGPVFKLEPIPA